MAVASLACFCWLIASSASVPLLGDYSEWTYHGVLLRDVLQGHANSAYWLKNYPVPNSLTTVGLGLLMLLMPWAVASKLWLAAEVILGLFAAAELRRSARNAQVWLLPLLATAMIFGTAFWFGFANFLLGVYFAMLICASLLRGSRSRWSFAALLLAAFFSHMVPWAFALLLLLLYAAQTRRWKLLWQALPSGLLAAWYFVARLQHHDADGKAGMVSSVAYATPAFVFYKVNTYLKCWGFVNPASTDKDSVLLRLVGAKVFCGLFLLNAAVGLVVLVLMVATARAAWRDKVASRFVWGGVLAFVAVALVLPGAAAGISDPGGRMMQVALWCGACLVSTRRRWVSAILAGCALLLLATNCYLFEAVAVQSPSTGALNGPMPEKVREFAHVYYASGRRYLQAIDDGRMDLEIYPTALFLKKDQKH